MNPLIAVAIGGALGSVLRFLMSESVYRMMGRDFPYGTLSVNVIGSFLAGLLYVLLLEKWSVGIEWHLVIFVGFLGGFTTFSAFSVETIVLLQAGEIFRALLNIVMSVSVCLLMTGCGFLLAKQFI